MRRAGPEKGEQARTPRSRTRTRTRARARRDVEVEDQVEVERRGRGTAASKADQSLHQPKTRPGSPPIPTLTSAHPLVYDVPRARGHRDQIREEKG